MRDIDEVIANEISHGVREIAVEQAEQSWLSPAGKIRRARRLEFLIKDLPSNSKILELGAGTGIQTELLIRHFNQVIGIDISEHLLNLAKRRVPQATFLCMDAHNPNFDTESFDAILGVSILHHLDWNVALKNCFALLKSGGVARFSEPNLFNPQIFLQKNIPFLKKLAGDSPDEYAFTRWQIESTLKKAGFSRVKVTPFEFLHPATPSQFIEKILAVEKCIEKTFLNEIAGSLLIEAFKN